MSVTYFVDDTKNQYWSALVRHCKHITDSNDTDFEYYIDEIRNVLKRYNSIIIIDEKSTTKWIESLIFGTEEDLILFKLTFN